MSVFHSSVRRSGLVSISETAATLSFVSCVLLALVSAVSAQDLRWAHEAGGTSVDRGMAIAADAAGNSCVAGVFDTTATFGTGASVTTLFGSGQEMFVAKYAPDGSLLWANRGGGASSSDWGLAVDVDAVGNCYVTGYFHGLASFEGGGNVINLQSSPNPFGSNAINSFLAKYDPSGLILWAKAGHGPDGVFGYAVAVEDSGVSHVAGTFRQMASFGDGGAAINLTATSAMYLASYDANGTLLDATIGARAGNSPPADFSIDLDAAGNRYVAGHFAGAAFGKPGGATILLNPFGGGLDAFVAKYDSTGEVLWAKRAGSNQADVASGLGVDAAGNSYVTGWYRNTATFGEDSVPIVLTTPALQPNIFVAKYDSGGALVWAKQAGAPSYDASEGLALDRRGNSYISGFFSNTATFGEGTNVQSITSSGSFDIFLAKYDSDGALVWVRGAGGTAFLDQGIGVSADGVGGVHVTGRFGATAFFGEGAAPTTLTTAGGEDIFVARYVDNVPPVDATSYLIDDVVALRDSGTLSNGEAQSLISKLNQVIKKINKGDPGQAIHHLGLFIDGVNDDIGTGTLSPAQGQPLLDAANAIIAALGG